MTDATDLLDASLLCMRELGAAPFWTVPTSWVERQYGDHFQPTYAGPESVAAYVPDRSGVIVSARPCPPSLAPRSASSALKAALASGHAASLTYALGTTGSSVVLRASRDGVRTVMTWEAKPGESAMRFVSAWALEPDGPARITSPQAMARIKA